MTTSSYVTKGTRVRAQWLDAHLTCLSGAQMKTGGRMVVVTGVVRHIRSDHPTQPVNATFFIDAEHGVNHEEHVTHCTKCGRDHVEVSAKHVAEVLASVSPPAPAVPDCGGNDSNGA